MAGTVLIPTAVGALGRYQVDWARQLGGTGVATPASVASDGNGNVYSAGEFSGELLVGSTTLTGSHAADGYVTKHDTSGALVWVRQLYASTSIDVRAVTTDTGGGVYVVGSFAGTLTVLSATGTFSTTASAGGADGFVVKYDAAGTPQWVRSIGGVGDDQVTNAAGFASSGVAVSGSFSGTATVGIGQPSAVTVTAANSNVPQEDVVARFDGAGAVVFAKQTTALTTTAPGATPAKDTGVAVDIYGYVYLTGYFVDDMQIGTTRLTSTGVHSYLARLGGGVGNVQWMTAVGGGTSIGQELAVGPSGGTVALVGSFQGSATFTVGGSQTSLTSAGGYDTYVASVSASTGAFSWAKRIGGPADDAPGAARIDSSGVVWVGGSVGGTGAQTGTIATSPSRTLRPGGYLAGFTSIGSLSTAQSVSALSGASWTATVSGLALSGASVLVTGGFTGAVTLSADFGGTALDSTKNGYGFSTQDGFVARWSSYGNHAPVAQAQSLQTAPNTAVTISLTAGDTDNDPLTYQITTQPAHGSLGSINGTSVVYTPTTGYTGLDTFAFTAADGFGGTSPAATVTISVGTGPIATDVRTSIPLGTASSPITLNGYDPAGGAVSFAVTSGPTAGTLTGTGANRIYSPTNPNVATTDSFTYTVTDNGNRTTTATAYVAVKPTNIVVILTDDQTLESYQHNAYNVMPKTKALLGDQGTTFQNFIVSYSECCPSRATLLTGQYSHNNGMLASLPPNGGVNALRANDTLATSLQAKGYYTSIAGKYLNGYGIDMPGTSVPAGWNDWFVPLDHDLYSFYNYDISVNGSIQHRGNAETDYSTDVLAARSEQVIRSKGGTSQPFFVLFTPTAPHVIPYGFAPIPAQKYAATDAGQQVDRTGRQGLEPSFNEPNISDKPQWLQADHPTQFTDNGAGSFGDSIDSAYQKQLGSLRSVDDAVERLYNSLKDTGELDNTLIVFTSDNGYQNGQHRLSFGKTKPYEDSSHLPLVVRGPGFPVGAARSAPVANIDLMPTFLAVSGATTNHVMDGTNLLPFAANASFGVWRSVLLENGDPGWGGSHMAYAGVRDPFYSYITSQYRDANGNYPYGTEQELYDLWNDPQQVSSQHANPSQASRVADMQSRLNTLKTCAGATCNVGFTP